MSEIELKVMRIKGVELIFSLRVNNASWQVSVSTWFPKIIGLRKDRVAGRFRWHKMFYFTHCRDIAERDVDWDNRHASCCGWSPTSHCGRFEGL